MSEEMENKSDVMLPSGEKLVLSVSPHISNPDSIRKIMLRVLCCLLPPTAAGLWFFGCGALTVIFWCLVFCVGLEALWCKLAGRPVKKAVFDGSAAVTGLLLGLNLPPAIPWWVCLIGAFMAIILGKQVFGGLGRNPFNPALVARVGLLIAFPALMTIWPIPRGMEVKTTGATPHPVTCATPLSLAKMRGKITDNRNPEAKTHFAKYESCKALKADFLGIKGGCVGETSVLAILIGGVMLLGFRLINWRVPVFFLGTVAVITGLTHYFYPGVTPAPLFHLLTGGLMLGAWFMATDMVTSPVTNSGCIVFAVGCGILSTVIRVWGNYPDGISFSILFMNALVPLIDRCCMPRPFGYTVKREAAK